MAEVHGSKTLLYVEGLDITTAFREAEAGTSRDVVDATGFTETSESHVVSPVYKSMLSAKGMLDVTGAVSAREYLTEDRLQDAEDSLAGTSLAVMMMTDDAIGDDGFMVYGSIHNRSMPTSHTDVIATSFEAQGNQGHWVKSLHPKAARTAAHNTARLDNTVASEYGAVSALQVFALTGTTPVITIKVQHDDNDNNWVDLLTHAAINSAGVTAGYADVQAVTGTVDRGLRIDLAVTSGVLTSITFALQIARLKAPV